MKTEMRDASQLLIADDEAVSRELLARALSAIGYICRESGSALEALELVHKEAPALLLVDFKMPELDGAQMLRQLRADPDPQIAHIPVIMMTGHEGHEVRCLEAGADDFVTKPINIAVLHARIETQLRLHSMRMQLQKQTEEAEAWRRNFERDLAAARLTQQSLIPQKPPKIPGWEVAASYQPVIEVGGDIYGWLRMKDGRFLFWIADAAGHGASAALLTTLAKLLFHHGSVEHETTTAIMEAVNNDFRGIFAGRSFMTAMCVTLDPESGRASVVGAGHPPLLVSRFGRGTETVSSSAPPLGLMERPNLAETIVDLARGDAFVLYTDGLFGRESARRPRLTPTQLAGMVNPFATDAETLLARMLKETAQNQDSDRPPDDVAAVVVRRMT
jgi:sigma-B regulation protein RsbU (phosphoserine phosphatase)